MDEDRHVLSADVRPARRLMRLAQDFLCDIVADGLPLEGRTLNLNEQGLAVALPEPVYADLDCVQVILTTHDGSLFHLTGRVVRQHQTTIGEVVVGIQLAELSVEAPPISSRNVLGTPHPRFKRTPSDTLSTADCVGGCPHRPTAHPASRQPADPAPSDSHRLCDSQVGYDT